MSSPSGQSPPELPRNSIEQVLANDIPAPMDQQASDRQKALLRARINADLRAMATPDVAVQRPRKRRHARRGLVAALASLGLLVTGGAATAFLLRAQPQTQTIVRCFNQASPPFAEGTPGTYQVKLVNRATADATMTAAAAVELCARAWQRGAMAVPSPDVSSPATATPATGTASGSTIPANPVPPLVACVLPEGTVGVFPGDQETCLRLGLPISLVGNPTPTPQGT